MRTVFSPSTLKMDEKAWNDKIKQNEFIRHILALFECISDYHMPKLVLTNEIYASLWDDNPLPPWRSNTDLKNVLVPIIYKNITKYTDIIDNCSIQTECSIDIDGELKYPSADDRKNFLIMLHSFLLEKNGIYFCLSIFENTIYSQNTCIYSCNCHNTRAMAKIISSKLQWIKQLDLIKYYWPPNSNNACQLLKDGVNISIQCDANDIEKKALLDFDIYPSFIKDAENASDDAKKRIIRTLSKRLRLTLNEASRDQGLQDEPINNERRIRVSDASRIHYKLENKARKIVFVHYYPNSKHDVGLR